MRLERIKFVFVMVSLMLCNSGVIAASLGTVKGQVGDSEGAIIKGAYLMFHRDPSGQSKPLARSDVIRETDGAGRFEVELEAGFYDVCVMAMAFTPQCRKVLVKDEEKVQYDVRMMADVLVMEHLGDKFQ
jgi:hypothetical protein